MLQGDINTLRTNQKKSDFRAVRAEEHASTDGSLWCGCRAGITEEDVSGSNRSSFPVLFLILIQVIIRRGLICKTAGMQLRTGRDSDLRFVLKTN
jgi:hypothetical protein